MSSLPLIAGALMLEQVALESVIWEIGHVLDKLGFAFVEVWHIGCRFCCIQV